VSEDREGDQLDAEIAADRRDVRDRKRRRVLFVPPLIALVIAAWALGVSRPREVIGARVIAGGRPLGAPLHVRVQVVSGMPGFESVSTVRGIELRPVAGAAVVGRAERTDDEGISEMIIDAPLPPAVTIEANVDGGYRAVGVFAPSSLRDPDPRNGALALRRNSGSTRGDLLVEIAPELGALAPPLPGAAWVRVRMSGLPASGAKVTFVADGGLSSDPSPVVCDQAGLARVELAAIAAPVALTATAERDGKTGVFSGMVAAVLAAPRPHSDGIVPKGSQTIELLSPSSRTTAYWDLWQSGVRIAGGRLAFDHGVATIAVPADLSGVVDLETNGSPLPPSANDLAHVATWPLVFASDDTDAWGAVKTSPRFVDPIAPAGGLADYRRAVVATLALAPPALPPRSVISDGLEPELSHEVRRGLRVRQFAGFAAIGGGFLEVGLMMLLGVFGAGPTVADAMRELGDDTVAAPDKPTRRWLSVVLTGLGIIVLMFAALATMALGMP